MAHFQGTASHPVPHALFRNGRPLSRTLLLSAMGLLLGIGAALAQTKPAAQKTAQAPAQKQTQPPPPDANGLSILQKSIAMYQKFNSYSGKANVDTLMIDQNGQTIKHIGSSTEMKLQRPNKIYIFFQTPIGSRRIYSDGTNFSVYDPSPDQYLTVPTAKTTDGLLQLLLAKADVSAGLDPLYFLTSKTLPKELTNVKVKESTTYNGHPVYIITGVTNVNPVVIKSGNATTTIPTSYWTWWIDRTSSLLYKVETKTPNIIKPVSFGNGATRTIKNIKGTLIVRHTVSELKPDANLQPGEFVFDQPKTATKKLTADELLNKKGK